MQGTCICGKQRRRSGSSPATSTDTHGQWQLGATYEYPRSLPYKQGVTGSSPVPPIGPVARSHGDHEFRGRVRHAPARRDGSAVEALVGASASPHLVAIGPSPRRSPFGSSTFKDRKRSQRVPKPGEHPPPIWRRPGRPSQRARVIRLRLWESHKSAVAQYQRTALPSTTSASGRRGSSRWSLP